MIATLLATVLASTPVLSDTMVRLGIVERDLTGDNVPEILSLTGRGQTVDSLEVTFTITSSGRTVFETKWSETRAVGFDAGRRVLSAAEHRRRLRQAGPFLLCRREIHVTCGVPDQSSRFCPAAYRSHPRCNRSRSSPERPIAGAADLGRDAGRGDHTLRVLCWR